jgi:hypothetical protein
MMAISRSTLRTSRAYSRQAPPASVAKPRPWNAARTWSPTSISTAPIDLLRGQAAVAEELAAASQREQPQPKAVLSVQPLIPRDPGQRLVALLGCG